MNVQLFEMEANRAYNNFKKELGLSIAYFFMIKI